MIVELDSELADRLAACAKSQDREPQDVAEEILKAWVEAVEPYVLKDADGEVIGNTEEIDEVLFESRYKEWLERHGQGGGTLSE